MFSCLSEEQYFDCFRYRSNGYAGVVQDKFSWVLLRLTESVDRTGAHRFDQPQRSFFDKTEGFSGSYDKAASALMQLIKSLKIQITTIHAIDAARYTWDDIKGIYIMAATIRTIADGGYRPL